jgi:hypothetical protein
MPLGPPVSVIDPPTHDGEFELAVAVGFTLTTTVVLADPVQPLLFVTVKMYLPAIAAVAEESEGLRTLLVKLLGPVQA